MWGSGFNRFPLRTRLDDVPIPFTPTFALDWYNQEMQLTTKHVYGNVQNLMRCDKTVFEECDTVAAVRILFEHGWMFELKNKLTTLAVSPIDGIMHVKRSGDQNATYTETVEIELSDLIDIAPLYDVEVASWP